MKLNIQDANRELLFAAILAAQGAFRQQDDTKPDSAKQPSAQDAEKPQSSQTAEHASPSTHASKLGFWGQSRRRRMLISVGAYIGLAYCAYLTFCLAFLLPSYGEDLHKEAGASFNAHTDVPLYYGGILLYIWKAAAVLKWRTVGRFEDACYRSLFGLAAHWAVCALLEINGGPVIAISFYPYFENTREIDRRVLASLHLAYGKSLAARVVLWSLVGLVGLGHLMVQWAVIWIKFWSAVAFMILVFSKLRQPFLQYVYRPLGRYVFQPLCRMTLASLGPTLHQYVYLPLVEIFPGPSTKTEHGFAEPREDLMVVTTMLGSTFVVVSSVLIFTACEDDTHSWQRKNDSNVFLHLAIFYTAVLWMVWRATSALNFAPAVRLDRLVYSSRIAWTLQALVFFPWLYSLWKVVYFPWMAFFEDEGIVARCMSSVKSFGSFTIRGLEINPFHPVGSVLGLYISGTTLAGFKCILLCLFLAMWAWCKETGRVAQLGPRSLYRPAT